MVKSYLIIPAGKSQRGADGSFQLRHTKGLPGEQIGKGEEQGGKTAGGSGRGGTQDIAGGRSDGEGDDGANAGTGTIFQEEGSAVKESGLLGKRKADADSVAGPGQRAFSGRGGEAGAIIGNGENGALFGAREVQSDLSPLPGSLKGVGKESKEHLPQKRTVGGQEEERAVAGGAEGDAHGLGERLYLLGQLLNKGREIQRFGVKGERAAGKGALNIRGIDKLHKAIKALVHNGKILIVFIAVLILDHRGEKVPGGREVAQVLPKLLGKPAKSAGGGAAFGKRGEKEQNASLGGRSGELPVLGEGGARAGDGTARIQGGAKEGGLTADKVGGEGESGGIGIDDAPVLYKQDRTGESMK